MKDERGEGSIQSLKNARLILKFRGIMRPAECPSPREPISHSRKNLAQDFLWGSVLSIRLNGA